MDNGKPNILIVDDEPDMVELLALLMQRQGLRTLTATSGEAALDLLRRQEPEVLLLDMKMPDLDGMAVMQKAKERYPDIPVVLITAYAKVRDATDAMRAGAHDYIAKPFEHQEVVRIVHRALRERQLKRKLQNMSSHMDESFNLSKMMGPSDAVSRLISRVNRVAKSDFTVIISGETGSGKELVARATHHVSPRSGGPFVAIDCGAIPETLLESELFGHEKGAFTGAVQQRPGKFESARNGTLLLDEISNMTLGAQAKLLRALQEKVFYRVGGTKSFEIDVRILVACNQELAQPVEEGAFRKDLFYRLNEFTICIPPLRERRGDIPYLANRFLETTNIELGKSIQGFTDGAIHRMLNYRWPGNVRQLRATIRRAVLMADEIITSDHLDIAKTPADQFSSARAVTLGHRPWENASLKEIIQRNTVVIERKVLEETLRHTGGNKAKAARLLKIDYKTIHTKLKKLGIT